MKHTGSCFCGAVEVQVTGLPEGMGYCHCSSCRSWSGGPVNAFTLWKPEAVEITSGKQHVATFAPCDQQGIDCHEHKSIAIENDVHLEVIGTPGHGLKGHAALRS